METYNENVYNHITASGATQVYTGSCLLKAIVVNTTAAGAIGIVDGTSGSTVNVGELAISVAEGTYPYEVSMKGGIRIIKEAATGNITVIYRIN